MIYKIMEISTRHLSGKTQTELKRQELKNGFPFPVYRINGFDEEGFLIPIDASYLIRKLPHLQDYPDLKQILTFACDNTVIWNSDLRWLLISENGEVINHLPTYEPIYEDEE